MARFSLLRQERGSAVVEFALVVPIFFLMVWGAIEFGRGYQRLNILTAALREGARYGSTLATSPCAGGNPANIKNRVVAYASAFGMTISTSDVVVEFPCVTNVVVKVTNYALFDGLTFFNMAANLVSRSATFRWERAP